MPTLLGETLTWSIGGYPHTFTASIAGPFGCDPCFDCHRRPTEGEIVWQGSYGDLTCNTCAHRNARSRPAAA